MAEFNYKYTTNLGSIGFTTLETLREWGFIGDLHIGQTAALNVVVGGNCISYSITRIK
jgi:hypothetical protein